MFLFQIMVSSKAGSYTAPQKSEVSHTAPERYECSHTAQERSEGSHTAPERTKGSHTGPASSDKEYSHLCESCIEDGIDKEAKHYCQDCKQKICDACKDHHRKLAVTRNHTISDFISLINIGLATVSGKLDNMNVSSDDAATKAVLLGPKVQSRGPVDGLATVSGNLDNMNNSSDDAETKTVLLGRKVQSRSRVNVKAGDDEETPYITGCAVMTNGDVVLCDFKNDKIKLLNSSGVLTGNMKLSSYPWDVSFLDPSSVIVTLPHNMQLQVVQVYPQLKPGRVIQLDKRCWGVAVGKGELYVTCWNIPGGAGDGEIRVLGLDGKVKRRLAVNQDGSFMFKLPDYITVNSSGEKIFVSDYDTDTVTCMSFDGRVIYTYKDDSMGGPDGLLCDSEDNILVCGWRSDNVQVLTADGKRHCTLLTKSGGLKDPCSIAYRVSDNTLLVGCRDSDHLLSFQLTK